jgi:hypothetical protein
MARFHRLLPVVAAGLCLAAWGACAEEVTIYRCTDAAGRLSLRDSPCAKGEKQEARSMARPKDAPAPPPQPARVVSTHRGQDTTRYVAVTPPRISYECVTVDGERYTSDSGVGRQRFEPNYLPYSVLAFPGGRVHGGGGGHARIGYRGGNVTAGVEVGGAMPRPLPRPEIVPVVPVGEWVRDTCYALPQAEACDRLRDDRSELNRRWHNAQPSERAQIDLQTRSLDARLDNDCGGR